MHRTNSSYGTLDSQGVPNQYSAHEAAGVEKALSGSEMNFVILVSVIAFAAFIFGAIELLLVFELI